MDYSVPQGSVLGPLGFISYTDEVSEIFNRHAVNYHLFADDKQLSESDKVSDTARGAGRVSGQGGQNSAQSAEKIFRLPTLVFS